MWKQPGTHTSTKHVIIIAARRKPHLYIAWSTTTATSWNANGNRYSNTATDFCGLRSSKRSMITSTAASSSTAVQDCTAGTVTTATSWRSPASAAGYVQVVTPREPYCLPSIWSTKSYSPIPSATWSLPFPSDCEPTSNSTANFINSSTHPPGAPGNGMSEKSYPAQLAQ